MTSSVKGGGGFQIMTADDEGRVGGLPKMKSFFTTIFGLIFASFTTKFG